MALQGNNEAVVLDTLAVGASAGLGGFVTRLGTGLAPQGVCTDVGTLRTTSGQRLGAALTGIDTPTLLGVWDTAPYFHDGSAATLDDVFRIAGGAVIAAGSGTVSGGAEVVAQWVEQNNDDSVHGRSYVALSGTGNRLTFRNVDGGAGGRTGSRRDCCSARPRRRGCTRAGSPRAR